MKTKNEQKLREIISRVFDVPVAQVTDTFESGQVNAWDSIGHLELIVAIEETFGIQFDLTKAAELTRVSLIVKALTELGL